MLRVMLDSQIYDLIINETGMGPFLNQLSTDGKIKILTTHIQRDELNAITDEEKRKAIQDILTELVPTSGGVYGVSIYGQATYGDGSSGGFGINDVRSKSKNHTKDALIATTAARDADALVTEDTRLSKRLETLKSKCQIWNFETFKSNVYAQL